MQTQRLATALVVALLAGQALDAAEAEPPGLTLDRALELANEHSPALAAAAARVRGAEAELVRAGTYPLNPEIGIARTRRQNDERRSTDREIAVSQGVELAGQRGKRKAVAAASLEAQRGRFERARQELVALVESRFADALAARDLAALAELEHRIAAELAAYESRRLDAGAATQIDLNLAVAVEGRAERNLELATAATIGARARLAEAVGLTPDEIGQPAGELPPSWPLVPTLAELERSALAARPDLAASRQEAAAADALVRLERATAMPDLFLGAARGREDVTDELTTFSAALAIPLFDRNQGAVAAARAGASERSATVQLAELAVRREVAEARSRFEGALRGRTALAERVEGTLEESLDLLQKSFAAGKLRASEVLLFRRELVDSRRDLIEASNEAWQARIALDLAVGRAPSSPTSPVSTSVEPMP